MEGAWTTKNPVGFATLVSQVVTSITFLDGQVTAILASLLATRTLRRSFSPRDAPMRRDL